MGGRRRRRTLGLAVVVALVALVGLIAAWPRTRRVAVPVDSLATAPGVDRASPRPPTPAPPLAGEPASALPGATPVQAPPADPPPLRASPVRVPAPAPVPPTFVRGEARFADGTAFPSGARLLVRRGPDDALADVVGLDVIAGRFEGFAGGSGSLRVVSLQVGDWTFAASYVVRGAEAPTDDAPWVVLVAPPRPPRIVVVDAASGAPIPGARAWIDVAGRREAAAAPATEFGPAAADGLVDLPWSPEAISVRVEAPGYVVADASVPPGLEPALRVEMARAGSIAVRCTPALVARSPKVLARREHTWGDVVIPLDGSGGRCEWLEPGTWTVTAVPATDDEPVRLEVDVRAGETASVLLDVQAESAPRSRDVRVSVLVPDGWKDAFAGEAQPTLSMEVRGADARTRGIERSVDVAYAPSGHQGLVVPRLLAGSYHVYIGPPVNWRTRIVVPEGDDGVRIELPASRRLEAIVRDATDGREVGDAEVSWAPWNDDGGPSGAYTMLRWDAKRRTLVGWIPAGSKGYVSFEGPEDFVEAEGAELSTPAFGTDVVRVDVPVVRAGSVRVILRVAGRPIQGGSILVRNERGTPTSVSFGPDHQLRGVPPGRMKVNVSPPDGFRPVEPREVEVRPGVEVEVTIDLVAK